MDTVCVDRAIAQQSVSVVHVEVAAGVWKRSFHRGDVREVLRQVTVDEGVRKVRGEPPGALELRLGGSHSEARCDRVQQSLATVPCFQQLTRVTLTGRGGVAQILRAV